MNFLPVTFVYLALANLYYDPFGDLLKRLFLLDIHGYIGLCYYNQYGQLVWGPSLFFISLTSVTTFASAITDSAGSGINGDVEATAGNRTDIESGLGEDARDNRLTIMGIREDTEDESVGNRTDAGSALREDIGDNKLAIVDDKLAFGDDGLATRDNKSSVDNDKLIIKIDKITNVDNRSNA